MMLAKKVRAMISNMRVMRSKAFGRFMKRSRISHKMRRHMRNEAKQANESNEANEMGGAFFDWDELDKAEGNEAAMMGGGGFFDWDSLEAAEGNEAKGNEATMVRGAGFFDWDSLEAAWEEAMREEVRKMRKTFMRSTANTNIENMKQQDELKVGRTMRRRQPIEAIRLMQQEVRQKNEEALIVFLS